MSFEYGREDMFLEAYFLGFFAFKKNTNKEGFICMPILCVSQWVERQFMYNPIEVGERIRELRRKRNLTQEELAEWLNISPVSMCRIEKGSNGASIDLLVEISNYFKTSLDYLIFGKKLSELEILLAGLPEEKKKRVINILFSVIENT